MKKFLLALSLCALSISPAFAANLSTASEAWGQRPGSYNDLLRSQYHAQLGVVAGQVEDTHRGILTNHVNNYNCLTTGSSTSVDSTINGNGNTVDLGSASLTSSNNGSVQSDCTFNFNY